VRPFPLIRAGHYRVKRHASPLRHYRSHSHSWPGVYLVSFNPAPFLGFWNEDTPALHGCYNSQAFLEHEIGATSVGPFGNAPT
jgi:hypothetical protein